MRYSGKTKHRWPNYSWAKSEILEIIQTAKIIGINPTMIYKGAELDKNYYKRLRDLNNAQGADVESVNLIFKSINDLLDKRSTDYVRDRLVIKTIKESMKLVQEEQGPKTLEQTKAWQVLKTKIDRRAELDTIAKTYYHKIDETPDFPLVARESWLPKGLKNVDEIGKRWLTSGGPPAPPISLGFFGGRPCVEWALSGNREMKLWDDPCFRLAAIEAESSSSPTLRFQKCTYFDYINTCEALAYELADWLRSNPGKKPDRLPGRGAPERIFDFDWRNAVPGQNALLVVLNGTRDGGKFLMQRRSKRALAEAQGTLHVVPAGTLQPPRRNAFRDIERDLSFESAIQREFAEELLRQDDEEPVPLGPDELQALKTIRQSGKLFYMGVGLDPVTTKPEILLCLAVRADQLGFDVERFIGNWEGEIERHAWNRFQLEDVAMSPGTLPAGAACLRRALEFFDEIDGCFRNS